VNGAGKRVLAACAVAFFVAAGAASSKNSSPFVSEKGNFKILVNGQPMGKE